jgi:hypothetical protein
MLQTINPKVLGEFSEVSELGRAIDPRLKVKVRTK